MSNLFKKGFASLALASAMASSVFAGSAANVDFKKGYQLEIPLHVIGSDNENAVAFKLNTEKGKIVVNFGKDASKTDSLIILSKKVAGERIESGNIVFKEFKASGENLMPSNLAAKFAKLTFTINQVDKANVLIISAASKKDFENATPFNVAMNRKDAKMHLFVTRDTTGLKNTLHLFANNVNWDQWEKEKMILDKHTLKKQNPQLNLYSDATESATDENMTNANILMGDGKGIVFKSCLEAAATNTFTTNTFTTNKHIVLSAKTMQNMTKSNTFNDNQVLHMSSRKFVLGSEYEAQRLKLAVVRDKRNLSLNPVEFKAEAEQTNSLSVGMGHFGKNTGKQYISLNFGRLLNDGIVGNLETHATNVVTKGLADQNGKWKKETYLLGTLVEHSKVFTDSIIVKHGIQGHLSFNSDRFLNVNNLGNNIETHTANLVAKGLSNKSGTFNTEKAYMIGQNGANISTVKKHFNSMAA